MRRIGHAPTRRLSREYTDPDGLIEMINLNGADSIRCSSVTISLCASLTRRITRNHSVDISNRKSSAIKLSVHHSFSESSCSALSPQTQHATSDVNKTQRDFENGYWKQKMSDFLARVDHDFVLKKHPFQQRDGSSSGVENCFVWKNLLQQLSCSSVGVARNSARGNSIRSS